MYSEEKIEHKKEHKIAHVPDMHMRLHEHSHIMHMKSIKAQDKMDIEELNEF